MAMSFGLNKNPERKKEILFKIIWGLPVVLAVIVSINHCYKWFEISNPSSWASFISISIEIVALTSLVALILGKNTFSIVFTFIIITVIQILGNIFFSFNYIDESGTLFITWQKFITVVLDGEWSVEKSKFWLAIIQGSVVPMLSLLSLHLISSFELKEGGRIETEEEEVVQPAVEDSMPVDPVPEVAEEKEEKIESRQLSPVQTVPLKEAVEAVERVEEIRTEDVDAVKEEKDGKSSVIASAFDKMVHALFDDGEEVEESRPETKEFDSDVKKDEFIRNKRFMPKGGSRRVDINGKYN
jgi:hypothetical protein